MFAAAPTAGALCPERGPEGGAVLRRMRVALGTLVVIEARAAAVEQARAALEAAFAALEEVAARMDPARPSSDLARLAAAGTDRSVPIDPLTHRVLGFAQRLSERSEGIFDPCLPERSGRIADLALSNPRGAPAASCRVPLLLDLGGIAKGFAVDRAVASLRAGGCSAGLVNAGGDLRVFGAQALPLLLRHAGRVRGALELQDAALAVSERRAAGAPPGHRGYYSRVPGAMHARRYAAVRAADAMSADALTKCVLLCRARQARRLLDEYGGERIF